MRETAFIHRCKEKDVITSDDYIELTAGQPIASVVPDIARIVHNIISSDDDFVAPKPAQKLVLYG